MDRETFLLRREAIENRLDGKRGDLSTARFHLMTLLRPLVLPSLIKMAATAAGIPMVHYLFRKNGWFGKEN